MSYLHSNNILHRKLNIGSIFLDENFNPKISRFSESIGIPPNGQYKDISLKGDIECLAPEVLSKLEYSKSSDVYSFALLMYSIVYKKVPLLSDDYDSIIFLTKSSKRPEFKEPIKDIFKNMIERCWSQEPSSRTTFDEIVNELKTNHDFIIEKVDEKEYQKYIKFIEESSISFKNIKTKMNFQKSFIHHQNRNENEIDLTKYKLKRSTNTNIEYESFELEKKRETKNQTVVDNKYCAQVYIKEISSFYKHEIINFSRKLSIISQIDHPMILNFVGYSPVDFDGKNKLVIVTEYNRSTLSREIHYGMQNYDFPDWNDTKKLIVIYGIASAMEYLHAHNIIHRANIYLDESLFPKLADITMFVVIKVY